MLLQMQHHGNTMCKTGGRAPKQMAIGESREENRLRLFSVRMAAQELLGAGAAGVCSLGNTGNFFFSFS